MVYQKLKGPRTECPRCGYRTPAEGKDDGDEMRCVCCGAKFAKGQTREEYLAEGDEAGDGE